MIHTSELMLGNWVTYLGTPMYVTGIFSDTVYLNFEGNEGDVFEIEEESLMGIPITEELLEKCGFKEFRRRGGFVAYSDNGYEYGNKLVLDHGDYSLVGINYGLHFLHELQNAYYMLTKKELEICP